MSEDRIIFHLQSRYFQTRPGRHGNGMCKEAMKKVLQKAFDLSHGQSDAMMHKNPCGFDIECRLDQFARFIVYRCEIGHGINGIKDLEPRIINRGSSEHTLIKVYDSPHQRCYD